MTPLHSPNIGVVDYAAVSRAIETELRGQGMEFILGSEVSGADRVGSETIVRHTQGVIGADRAVFCAGLWSDQLATAFSGAPANIRILRVPRAYLHLAADQAPVVRGMVYPVPDPDLPFLGVHVTKHIDGHVSLGSTAMFVGARDGYDPFKPRFRDVVDILSWPGTWHVARKFWKTGITEVKMASSRRTFVGACARYVSAVANMRLGEKWAAGSGRKLSLVTGSSLTTSPSRRSTVPHTCAMCRRPPRHRHSRSRASW